MWVYPVSVGGLGHQKREPDHPPHPSPLEAVVRCPTWELNRGSLQENFLPFTAEPSLQPYDYA